MCATLFPSALLPSFPDSDSASDSLAETPISRGMMHDRSGIRFLFSSVPSWYPAKYEFLRDKVE
jgi:hypothetical protein